MGFVPGDGGVEGGGIGLSFRGQVGGTSLSGCMWGCFFVTFVLSEFVEIVCSLHHLTRLQGGAVAPGGRAGRDKT